MEQAGGGHFVSSGSLCSPSYFFSFVDGSLRSPSTNERKRDGRRRSPFEWSRRVGGCFVSSGSLPSTSHFFPFVDSSLRSPSANENVMDIGGAPLSGAGGWGGALLVQEFGLASLALTLSFVH